MNALRSLLFAAAFYVGSFVIVTTGVLWSLFDRRAVRSTSRRWSRWHRGCARVLLGVHPGNTRARRFYERHGFEVIGERVFQVGTQRITDPIYARGV